jgi:hypothetical protein
MPRILHVLSQRPSLTDSGVTLDSTPVDDPITLRQTVEPLTWGAVFRRVEEVWERVL